MEKKAYTIDQQATDLLEGFDQLEQMRMEGYEMALSLHATKTEAQQRERARLVAKYGEQHARVRSLDRKLANGPVYAKAVRSQHTRASNKVPDLSSGAWQAYGLVVDKQGNPLENLTVSLFNAKGSWERELGYACTDPSGYFSLVVESPELVKKYWDKPLTLTVTNFQQQVLLRDTTTVYLTPDKTETRRLVIDLAACAPPEKESATVTDAPGPPVEPPQDPKGYVVWGFVKNHRGLPIAGVQVKAVANTPDGDCTLGKPVITDAKGRYKIPYTAADFNGDPKGETGPDLTISLTDASGKKLYEHDRTRNAARVARVDVMVRKRWLFC